MRAFYGVQSIVTIVSNYINIHYAVLSKHSVSCEKYAKSVHTFLQSSLFTGRRLVGIGHSLGGVAMYEL